MGLGHPFMLLFYAFTGLGTPLMPLFAASMDLRPSFMQVSRAFVASGPSSMLFARAYAGRYWGRGAISPSSSESTWSARSMGAALTLTSPAKGRSTASTKKNARPSVTPHTVTRAT